MLGNRVRARVTRWLRAPLLAGAALLLLANANDGLQFDTLLRDFETIAFGVEFEQETDGRLHKWAAPIRFYLDIRAGQPELYRRLTAEHLAQLRELTGLDIGFVDDPATADVVMIFDRADTLVATAIHYAPSLADSVTLLRDALCFGRFSRNQAGEIISGLIGIPSDRAPSEGKLPHCIVEETTQLLGLPNDSDLVNPSIFNDRSVIDYLTEHDRVLVRLLYDRRLPPGMGREEAVEAARGILREQGF